MLEQIIKILEQIKDYPCLHIVCARKVSFHLFYNTIFDGNYSKVKNYDQAILAGWPLTKTIEKDLSIVINSTCRDNLYIYLIFAEKVNLGAILPNNSFMTNFTDDRRRWGYLQNNEELYMASIDCGTI